MPISEAEKKAESNNRKINTKSSAKRENCTAISYPIEVKKAYHNPSKAVTFHPLCMASHDFLGNNQKNGLPYGYLETAIKPLSCRIACCILLGFKK
ncbi:hypothetical protein [Legionella londiniensis]|uniref:hypothetical protein n=1 Tax=Legionella londiniensis TaxID=45068 RepID=UPI0013EFAB4D|nr:hypothetical protein [Legionella londiniensis]